MHGFKALSRMSSSPTAATNRAVLQLNLRFKALSRMSSSPTEAISAPPVARSWFQSAVAHELFSDHQAIDVVVVEETASFKALSRMSSSPTA